MCAELTGALQCRLPLGRRALSHIHEEEGLLGTFRQLQRREVLRVDRHALVGVQVLGQLEGCAGAG